ncbi:MAG: hypothetical protein KAW16_05135 [candidate division Zixibacteria bacterium]|nr:hypothetical protein [candidate division Zixibacteria bacterium]
MSVPLKDVREFGVEVVAAHLGEKSRPAKRDGYRFRSLSDTLLYSDTKIETPLHLF